ncbi:MBG domain-containing protein, partial [Acinetobacter baumannii]
TYTATAASRAYGAANPALTGTVAATGLLNGATLATVTTGTAAWTTPATTASPVGSYAINGSGLSANSGNYTFSFVQAAGNATALKVTPAAVTVTYT